MYLLVRDTALIGSYGF